MHGFAVYVKEGLPFAQGLSLENSTNSYLCFQLAFQPTWITDCDSHSPALLDLSMSSDAGICSTMAFPPLRNSNHVLVSVSTDFQSNSKWDAQFHCIDYDYSRANWDGLHDNLRDVLWEEAWCQCCC